MSETVTCTFMASDYDAGILIHVINALQDMGVEISAEFSGTLADRAQISVTVPKDPDDAKAVRTRNAGRKRATFAPPMGSPIKLGTTLGEFLSWLKDDGGHTAAEAADALGLRSRAVYFRRLRSIREYAAQDPQMTLIDLDSELATADDN